MILSIIFEAYSDNALLASLRDLTSVRNASTSFGELIGSKPSVTLLASDELFLPRLPFALRTERSLSSITPPSRTSLFSARPSSAARSRPGPVRGRPASDSPREAPLGECEADDLRFRGCLPV